MDERREGFCWMLMKHCAGHRLQSNTQPTSRGHHSRVHSRAGSFSSCADWFGVDSLFFMSSSSPPPPRTPHCLLYWFAGPCLGFLPALLRWCSIQSWEEGWAACVHWGMARKRQPLHLRGSTCQEQSRCYWCSKCKFSQCYAMTMVDPDFEGVGT